MIRGGVEERYGFSFETSCYEATIDKGRLIYSSDGVDEANGMVLEAKAPRQLPEEAKPMHIAQCQWGMGLTGIRDCLLIYQAGDAVLECHLEFDKKLFDYYVLNALAFLAEVRTYCKKDSR